MTYFLQSLRGFAGLTVVPLTSIFSVMAFLLLISAG